jgi:hypothetical protein
MPKFIKLHDEFWFNIDSISGVEWLPEFQTLKLFQFSATEWIAIRDRETALRVLGELSLGDLQARLVHEMKA